VTRSPIELSWTAKKNTFSLLIIKLKSINFNCLLEFGEAQSCGVKTVPHIWMQKNIQISEKYPNIQLERRTADIVGQYLARPRSTLI